jgi:hypothetical protein
MFHDYSLCFPLVSIFSAIFGAQWNHSAFPYNIINALKAYSIRTCDHIWRKEPAASSDFMVLIINP